MNIEIYSTSQHYLGKVSREKFDKIKDIFDYAIVDEGADFNEEPYCVVELANTWTSEEEQAVVEIIATA